MTKQIQIKLVKNFLRNFFQKCSTGTIDEPVGLIGCLKFDLTKLEMENDQRVQLYNH